MNSEIRKILEGVRDGDTSVEEALLRIKTEPFADIGYAKVDLHRKVRQGAAEVIYGAGKTPEQIDGIDYQILIEADYIVNASESGYSQQAIRSFMEHTMKTAAGIRLTKTVFGV